MEKTLHKAMNNKQVEVSKGLNRLADNEDPEALQYTDNFENVETKIIKNNQNEGGIGTNWEGVKEDRANVKKDLKNAILIASQEAFQKGQDITEEDLIYIYGRVYAKWDTILE